MAGSPSQEVTEVKKNLKNDKIDKEMARSFTVANYAHMSSIFQKKLLRGNTITSLNNDNLIVAG